MTITIPTHITYRAQSTSPWAGLNLGEYLKNCEGRVWQHENTLEILKCAEQIDALIVRLMRAAGVQMIE